ncbi:MAG: primosomal protein N' [Oscillospiraceae bacterium]|nr:primosomal protein N' [Oscillospiraceae bacterium]
MNEQPILLDGSITMPSLIALVAVEKAFYAFDRLYSYAVLPEIVTLVQPGKRVLVSFGRGTRRIEGMIFAVKSIQTAIDDGDVNNKDLPTLKPISEVLDDYAYMTDEMLNLAKWLKENTFCTYYNAVRCIMPPILRDPKTASRKLEGNTTKIVSLSENFEPDILTTTTAKQKSVIQALENGSASIKELCYLCGVSTSVVTNLVKKGILVESSKPISELEPDTTSPDLMLNVDELELSDEQLIAFDGLVELLDTPTPQCALLHGVTGSGKTSVFIKLVGECLLRGKSALILVPEIALTPQTIRIFEGYFGQNAAVIHSGLSLRKRGEEYKRIREGRAKIILGTRSAVFAPMEQIGLIVIDEEGEHTYKSERSPRYHVRDVAKQRCFYHKSLLLLASATPSMDSYRKAKIEKYTLFQMDKRYSENALPDVRIIDMQLERATGNESNFSDELITALQTNLERGEQSLLLLNRRGYHTFVCCQSCREVATCPHCGIALTFHKAGNRLRCHYCDFNVASSESCSKCGEATLHSTGTGTQRIQDELLERFPNARILRMDADTTMTKGAYEKGFGSFGKGEYDIMVGTQMVAKGLDFPNVTLVGILLIDNSLYAGDYIGYERTFSLITQVVGRAGRGDKIGTAFLQTFTPDHYVLRLAAKQDYRGFYAEEEAIRKALLFPPFCELCIVEISGVFEPLVAKTAFETVKIFGEILAEANSGRETPLPVRVLGPVKNGIGNIYGKFRYRLVIKCKNSPLFRAVMKKTLICISNLGGEFQINAWFD